MLNPVAPCTDDHYAEIRPAQALLELYALVGHAALDFRILVDDRGPRHG